MAITKLKVFMKDGSRVEVTQMDANYQPLAISVVDSTETIDVMTTELAPTRIASFPRSSINFWSSDLATIANA